MDTSSPGYRYWTTYEVEGDKARITGHYMREQEEAAIAVRQPFSLKVYGLGAGLTIGVRAVTRRLQTMTARIATAPSQPFARPTVARRVLTPMARDGNSRRLDGGTFDPWGDHLPDWVMDDPFPPIDPTEPPQPPGGGGGGFMHAAVRIELFAVGNPEAVQTWELNEGIAGNVREVTFEILGFPGENSPMRRVGWWNIVVTPTGYDPVMIHIEGHATYTRVPFRTQPITTRLFDHLFRVALEALVPRASIDGSTLRVSIGEELAHEFGISPTLANENISPIVSHARLTSLNITAVSGRALKDIARTKKRKPLFLPRVQDGDIAIRIQAAFDKASATVHGFDVARLNGDFGEIFLVVTRNFTELMPISFIDVDFSTLASWAISLAGLFTEVDKDIVNTVLETEIYKQERVMRTYVREVLSRAVGLHAVAHEVSFGANAWQIRYFNDPPIPDPNAPPRKWIDNVAGGVGGVGGMIETFAFDESGMPTEGTPPSEGGTPPEETPTPAPASNDPLGEFPEGFIVEQGEQGEALERLDRHQSLVVIMMENRSFDHLLGGLMNARPRPDDKYDGPPSSAGNAPAGGFADRVPLVNVNRIAMGTAIPVDPRHYTGPTAFQMGDGTAAGAGSGDMQGFARDVMNRTDSPQLAMTMYGEQHLPVYYKLADEFRVCDRWFCAHPGPTWPNRFATVMGSIPAIDNFAIDDPQIGFLKHPSIYDTLTSYGIEWKVFESDLSLVRMFDRYRLDDRRVVPIDDKADGLDATLRTPGSLPRVMFVEPNFADLPPLATANDDHPPADLANGQAFIARVCDAIWSAGRFNQCLVCITYDEHGGFYDHVAPPGTAKSTLAEPDSIPQLHPQGPKYMGPRVPSFILSPYVSAGKPDHTIYDHTSILKTILVHNRAKLPRSVFKTFGERVNQAAHFGQALDLPNARQSPLPFDPMRRRPAKPTGPFGEVIILDEVFTTDGAPSGPPPIPPRTVTILPRSAAPQETDPEEPDFHASLKGALKPRP